jgi:hypothetical protein
MFYVSCVLFAADEADRYEAIAVEGLQKHQVKIEINEPEILPNIMLESTQSNSNLPILQYDHMDSRGEFNSELEKLKKQYAPFLRDHTPLQSSTRNRMDMREFQFRKDSSEDRADISRVFDGKGKWEDVTVPHYTGPLGWWRGYYRKEFEIPEDILEQDVQILHFGAVSYACDVYLNGRMVGSHVGWFSSFEIDVTEFIKHKGKNILVVEIRNEPPAQHGQGGRKIFAATSPGWDDPLRGWHCDQSGGGIWQEVYIEGCPKIHITDIFVRPNIDEDYIDVIVEVYQPPAYMLENKLVRVKKNVDLRVSIYPMNFNGNAIENVVMPTKYSTDACFTEYIGRIRMEDYKLWQLEEPYLYSISVQVFPKGKSGQKDVFVSHFGMRKFHMDENSEPKGTLYLNNEEIILRGANHMGHLQREAMEGDEGQIIEDILIAKMANMNFWRLTQSPCQPEVYDLCDRLGIMTQTDLPLFELLSRWALEEAIKQAGEMEKLVRNHPCNVMITYINEANARHQDNRCYLNRDELNDFFKAATRVVHTHNPDRVVKPIDGDFYPPPPGFPDIHTYCLWYGSSWLPWGKMHRGYCIPGKPGWKWGTGEYGIEGLEAAETMFEYYPKDWLPENENQLWNPSKIAMAQTWRTHLVWYDSQDIMREWIKASQDHQAWGIGMMTRDLRRSKNNASSAVHLLIDAWPAGWMKSLVDVQRIPKKAYFAYRDALTPLAADIRTDRTRYYGGQPLDLEFWVLNDRKAPFIRGDIVWEVWLDNKRIFSQSKPVEIPSYDPKFCGYFRYITPKVRRRADIEVRLGLFNPDGSLIHVAEKRLEIFPSFDKEKNRCYTVAVAGKTGQRGWKLVEELGAVPCEFSNSYGKDLFLTVVDSRESYNDNRAGILEFVENGGTAIFLEQPGGTSIELDGAFIKYTEFPHKVGREFVSRKTEHRLVKGFEPFDFGYWYNPEKDYIDYIITSYADCGNKISLEFASNARKFNFAPEGYNKAEDYINIGGKRFDTKLGYGWDRTMNGVTRERNLSEEPVLDTGVTMIPGSTATFSVELPNGTYYITPIGGDSRYSNYFEVATEGKTLNKCYLEAGDYTCRSYEVQVNDGKLDVSFTASANKGLIVAALVIEQAQDKLIRPELSHVLQTGYGDSRYAAVGEIVYGKGSIIFDQIKGGYRIDTNPIMAAFYNRIIEVSKNRKENLK